MKLLLEWQHVSCITVERMNIRGSRLMITPTPTPTHTNTHTHSYLHLHMHTDTHTHMRTHTCTTCIYWWHRALIMLFHFILRRNPKNVQHFNGRTHPSANKVSRTQYH